MSILEQNLEIAQNFTPMTDAELQVLRDRVRHYARMVDSSRIRHL